MIYLNNFIQIIEKYLKKYQKKQEKLEVDQYKNEFSRFFVDSPFNCNDTFI